MLTPKDFADISARKKEYERTKKAGWRADTPYANETAIAQHLADCVGPLLDEVARLNALLATKSNGEG